MTELNLGDVRQPGDQCRNNKRKHDDDAWHPVVKEVINTPITKLELQYFHYRRP